MNKLSADQVFKLTNYVGFGCAVVAVFLPLIGAIDYELAKKLLGGVLASLGARNIFMKKGFFLTNLLIIFVGLSQFAVN